MTSGAFSGGKSKSNYGDRGDRASKTLETEKVTKIQANFRGFLERRDLHRRILQFYAGKLGPNGEMGSDSGIRGSSIRGEIRFFIVLESFRRFLHFQVLGV